MRPVIDLRNDDELGADAAPRPTPLTTVHLPLDGSDDREFWNIWDTGPQFGTRCTTAHTWSASPSGALPSSPPSLAPSPEGWWSTVVGARPHWAGHDAAARPRGSRAKGHRGRLCAQRRAPSACYAARGEEDQGPLLEGFLAAKGTTAGELIITTLAGLDVEACQLAAGLASEDLAALRRRLLAP